MVDQSHIVNEAPKYYVSKLDFATAKRRQKFELLDPSNILLTDTMIENKLAELTQQLIELVEREKKLDEEDVLAPYENIPPKEINAIVEQRIHNRETIEKLFVDLSHKMWQGTLPATSIATVDSQYNKLTGRLLNEDLKGEQWSAYFSAYQLSIDILNGMTLVI